MTTDRLAHLRDRHLYRAFYEADTRYGIVDMPTKDEPRLLWALDAIKPTDDVIDIGCHKGELTFSLWSVTTGRVVGLDISDNAIWHARGLAAKEQIEGIEWQVGEAEALPFPNNSFDVAVLCEILEHVPDPAVCLAEAERVVRVGGTIVLSTPGNARDIDTIDARTRDPVTGFQLDMHVREYDPEVELKGKPGLTCGTSFVDAPALIKEIGHSAFVYHLARYEVRK